MLIQKLTIALLALGIVLCVASHADASLLIRPPLYLGLNSGLVGNWSFNQADLAGVIAYDRSGNANNGTLTNGPKQAIGKIGQGLSFDGTNDYVATTNEINSSGDFTLSMWMYPRNISAGTDIVGRTANGGNFIWPNNTQV